MHGRASREWLIKTAGNIKGPFTSDEIIQALKNKEIVVIDEIARSFGRWKLIRDERIFEQVVLELQNKDDLKGEKTFTQTETDALTEELSQQILSFSQKEKLLSNLNSQKVETQKIEVPQSARPIDSDQKVYGVEKKKKIKIDKSIAIKVLLTFSITVGVAFFFFYKGKEQEASFEEFRQIAIDQMAKGDIENARNTIKKALDIREDNDLMFKAASLDLMLGESAGATSILEKLKYKTKNRASLSQVHNYLGVINLKNYSLAKAKLELDASLEFEPQFVPALYNRGVVDYLENNFDQAFQNFSKAMVHGGLDGSILLAVTDVITKGKQNFSGEDIQRANYYIGLIQRHIQNFQVYKQELYIANAYLNSFLNQDKEVITNISKALDVDPNLSGQHLMDQSLYRGLIGWESIANWVEKMSEKYPTEEALKTLTGYLHFRGADKIKGKELIEALLKPDFSNIQNQAIYAYILLSLGQVEKAEAALVPVIKNQDFLLPKTLMAEICLRNKNMECSKQYYDEILKKDPQNLGSFVGLGKIYLELKQKEKAIEYIQRAYKLSSFSKEVLQLKNSIEGL